MRTTALLVLLLTASVPALSQSLLVGTNLPSGPMSGGWSLTVSTPPEADPTSQFLAAPFTLFQAADVTHIDLGLGQIPAPVIVRLDVTNAIGPTVDSQNLFGTYFFDAPAYAARTVIGFDTSIVLPAGNYFLVVSVDRVSSTAWPSDGISIPTSFGAVGSGFWASNAPYGIPNPSFPASSSWHFMGGYGELPFQVLGEVSSVPIPAAAWLFVPALAGLVSITRSRSV